MNNITAGIVTYGDWRGLSRTIWSLMYKVSQIIVIHCKFIGFPLEIPESFIETWKIAHRLHDRSLWSLDRTIVQFYQLECKREWQCRQFMLDMCERFAPWADWLLIIDSDEYVAGDFNKFRSSLLDIRKEFPDNNVFGLIIENQETGEMKQWYPRVWYKPWNMMYKFSHYRFCHKSELNHYYDDYDTPITKVLDGIKLIHDKSERLPEYSLAQKEYAKWLKAEEQYTYKHILNRPMGRAYPTGCDEKDLEYAKRRFRN